MRHAVQHAPTFSTLELKFAAGESIVAQPSCMLAMSTGFEVRAGFGTQMGGPAGLSRAVKSVFAGESFFTAIYTAKREGEELTLAPGSIGEIRALPVGDSERIILASGAFLACTEHVRLDLKYAGVRGLLATRGLFLMRTSGEGTVFVASYGSLVERALLEGERFVVDNRYIVAFSETVRYELVTITGSLRHSFFSGEGLVNRYTGPGRILYQTRPRPSAGLVRGLFNTIT